jgi:hypothetical protein
VCLHFADIKIHQLINVYFVKIKIEKKKQTRNENKKMRKLFENVESED